MIARGKPYVNINADHSEPGKMLKYAPKPYLYFVQNPTFKTGHSSGTFYTGDL